LKIALRLLAGPAAAGLPGLGCARPGDQSAETAPPPAKMPSTAADVSIGHEPLAKPAPAILPFSEVPEPEAIAQMLWHRNGRPLRQMEFNLGRRDGRFISWNEQGEKLSELVYRNDVLVRSIE
jgi:hypothetical protein